MRKAVIVIVILLGLAGLVWLQTAPPAPDLATYMPSGALLYLSASNFGRLVHEWDQSRLKQNWLASDSNAVFQQSNLFSKLGGVYNEYSAATSFAPGLREIGEIAGSQSALALYGIRDVEFLYISRVPESQLSSAQLWAARGKFEQRDAAGTPFWMRTDPASGRTVGFTFAKGWLFVATRDDLIARSLALVAGGKDTSVASERWYQDATAASKTTGELRMVMNVDALRKSVYFRSYWVQRNAAAIRRYYSGIADVNRTDATVTESRVFLRSAENPGDGPSPADRAAAARLAALAPHDAGLYRVWTAPDPAKAAGSIVDKLIAPPAAVSDRSRYAPGAADLSQTAGTEADLETRIDEPPLPSETTLAESAAPLREAMEKAGLRAMLQVQSTAPASRTFIRMPCAIVLAASSPWDQPAVEQALTGVIEPLWTTTGLGAGWKSATAGNSSVRALDGLGTLYLATRENLLFLSNDAGLLGVILDHGAASSPASASATYAAVFRLAREQAPYERLMTALDFASSANANGAPAFFSQNIAGLGRVLSPVSEIRVTEQDEGARVSQTVDYRMLSEPRR
jgi:hypothetical protein